MASRLKHDWSKPMSDSCQTHDLTKSHTCVSPLVGLEVGALGVHLVAVVEVAPMEAPLALAELWPSRLLDCWLLLLWQLLLWSRLLLLLLLEEDSFPRVALRDGDELENGRRVKGPQISPREDVHLAGVHPGGEGAVGAAERRRKHRRRGCALVLVVLFIFLIVGVLHGHLCVRVPAAGAVSAAAGLVAVAVAVVAAASPDVVVVVAVVVLVLVAAAAGEAGEEVEGASGGGVRGGLVLEVPGHFVAGLRGEKGRRPFHCRARPRIDGAVNSAITFCYVLCR